jgi:hypothetical protein
MQDFEQATSDSGATKVSLWVSKAWISVGQYDLGPEADNGVRGCLSNVTHHLLTSSQSLTVVKVWGQLLAHIRTFG